MSKVIVSTSEDRKLTTLREWLIPQFLSEKDEVKALRPQKAQWISWLFIHYTGHNVRKTFKNFLERNKFSPPSNNEDNSREWEEKKLELEAELTEKAHLIKLQEEEITNLEQIKKLEITTEPIVFFKKIRSKFLFGDEQFEDALTNPKLTAISTIPRSKEEHDNYNNLNNEFSKRLEGDSNKLKERGCFGFG
ncbi:unnamed protein product [Rhizophagus irregularis]|nr:unnamed protein product [Rhizophagus irregularis]